MTKPHYTLHFRNDLHTPLWCVSRRYRSGVRRTPWTWTPAFAVSTAATHARKGSELPMLVEIECWWTDRTIRLKPRAEAVEFDQYGARRF